MNKVTLSIVQAYRTRRDKSVQEKYRILKTILERKYGRHSGLLRAVIDYENTRPTSSFLPPSYNALEGEVLAAGAHEDPDVLAAANGLLDSVKAVTQYRPTRAGRARPNSALAGRMTTFLPSKASREKRRSGRWVQRPKDDKEKEERR